MGSHERRRWILGIAGVMALVLCGAASEQEGRRVPVVTEGKAVARIVVPAEPSRPVRASAKLLADYVEKSTGAKLETVKEPGPKDGLTAIHCGDTEYVKGLKLGTEGMDADGFVIVCPDEKHVVLAGASDQGLEYAVDEVLERYVGVRWLFPGAIGEHVPKHASLRVPMAEVREEPAFRHRLFSGLGKEETPEHKGEQLAWARRNRLRNRIEFHHNLWRLFLPETYTSTHPHFFPIIDGKRFLPTPPKGKTSAQDTRTQACWQPCFTAKGSVEEAVRVIREHFKKKPHSDSYSLGINDSNQYCTCLTCLKMDGEEPNTLGVRHVSPSYYRWCNAIARGVNAKYPDKVFGLLAYNGAYDPAKGLKLNDHVVPFITYDRMKWVDPELRRMGHEVTEAWEKHAAVLGWYDYIYGGQFYLAPRVYFHERARYLRYGYQHNVRHYYAEAYPSDDWHEGPKLYLTLKLLWNPNRKVDDILDDWYVCAVGPEAAPYLKQYFARWEEFWTKRAPTTGWFKRNGNRQYLDFHSSAYLDALTMDDFNRCDEALKQAVATAPAGIQRQRAQYFLDGFDRRREEMRSQIRMRNPKNVKTIAQMQKTTFDKGVDGWSNWQRDYSRAVFSFDPTCGRTAPGALKMDTANSSKSPLCFTRSIPLARGKTYRATVWFKSKGLDESADVNLVVKWKDKKGKWLKLTTSEVGAFAPFPDDWKEIKIYIHTGQRALWQQMHSAVLLLTVNRTPSGTVWFDDFTFDEVEIIPPLTPVRLPAARGHATPACE